MNALDSRIRELVAYARERDGEDRTALFRNLVDLFLTNKAPTKQPTRNQLLEVVNALIPHVEPESRRTVSDLLASMSNPPMDLIHCIVKDRASLVSKLLKTAPFDEDELIELIEITGREHHQELAARTDLSANVWIALARATPSAPPYGSNSTLALWREDLGLNKTGSEPDLTKVSPQDLASVTPLHPEKYRKPNAKIRILKTDEDIVTSHLSDNKNNETINFVEESSEDQNGSYGIDQIPQSEGKAPSVLTDDEVAQKKTALNTKPSFRSLRPPQPLSAQDSETVQHSISVQNDEAEKEPKAPEPAAEPTTIKRPLIEPETGSWAWRSDRDGFIIEVSSQAERLTGGNYQLIGAAMLDMLALNTKLGHPVSRAFQRRSSIHEAPIYLAHLEQAQRYWTLEASPLFDPNTGAFDGYEGILKPVIPARGEDDIIPADDISPDVTEYASSSLNNEEKITHNTTKAPSPSTDNEFSFSPSKPLNWFDERGMGGEENTIPQSNPILSKKHKNTLETLLENPSDINQILGDTINEVAENLSPERPEIVSREESKAPNTPSNEVATELETPTPDVDIDSAENDPFETIQSTLMLMEEALGRLAKAEENNNFLQVRLQSEIAQACARTLKSEFAALKKR
ncbi:hypothetical protein [Kordiimonas sp. SCSIO 12610]|uniref:hypothetical protein n=1 Tax=Kordiimonas sp. SCSIO 12610 TaxID=2829597 RepID=UPI002109259D|nr:hypothetical protein [Kordiimonas sp. SCSIO 12610]UTW54953.1 hypothetical protein KFF44_14265 [Kordiimonas sp. SCSIO 12610]